MRNTIKRELIKVQQSSVFRVVKRKVLFAAIGAFASYSVFATQPKGQELNESRLFIEPAGRGLNECGLHASVRTYSIINGVVKYDIYYCYFNSIADAEQYIAENTFPGFRGAVLACYATGPMH